MVTMNFTAKPVLTSPWSGWHLLQDSYSWSPQMNFLNYVKKEDDFPEKLELKLEINFSFEKMLEVPCISSFVAQM